MVGCFNPILGQIWTNPAVGLNVLIAFFPLSELFQQSLAAVK